MKHCIIMTAYKDLSMINRIISYIPNTWGIYVHLDKKSAINSKDVNPKAHVQKVNKVYWGGVEHLHSFLLLLEMAYTDGNNYDYFHLTTGQDFFSSSPENFDEILGNEEKSYFEVHPCPREGWWGGGFDIIKYRTLASFCDINKNKANKIVDISINYIQRILHLARPLPPYPLFCGSVYGSLHRTAVYEILYGETSKDLLTRLFNSTCGEEIFFQTVLMNSEVRKKVINNNLRYIDWNVKCPPKYLKEEDFDNIINSKTLFCRKVDSTISDILLRKLCDRIISVQY